MISENDWYEYFLVNHSKTWSAQGQENTLEKWNNTGHRREDGQEVVFEQD